MDEPRAMTPATGEDAVNHPPHYGGNTRYEHVKVAEAWGLASRAHLYNATKYICRAGKKNPATRIEDLKKALWYLQREIDLSEREAVDQARVQQDQANLTEQHVELQEAYRAQQIKSAQDRAQLNQVAEDLRKQLAAALRAKQRLLSKKRRR